MLPNPYPDRHTWRFKIVAVLKIVSAAKQREDEDERGRATLPFVNGDGLEKGEAVGDESR